MANASPERDRRRHVRNSQSVTAELDELVTSSQNARTRFSIDEEPYLVSSASINGAFADDQRVLLHARSSSRGAGVEVDEEEWADVTVRYPPNGRGRARGAPTAYGKEDFYVRMIKAWRETRRKRRWKAYGGLVSTFLQEVWYAKWTVKVSFSLVRLD